MHKALSIVLEEGLENRWKRHQEVHKYLKKSLEGLGFSYLVKPANRLPNLNAVYLPKKVKDEAKLRTQLLNGYNIEVGGGLGAFAGKIWRVGIMGESCTKNHVNMLVGALKELL